MPEHVVFQCTNGVVLGLFSEMMFEEEHGQVADGFRGVTVAINRKDGDGVFRAHDEFAEFADYAWHRWAPARPAPRASTPRSTRTRDARPVWGTPYGQSHCKRGPSSGRCLSGVA